jgi:hypothetical protein
MTMPLTKLNVPTEQPLLLWATVSNINSGGDPIIWEHVGRALRSKITGRWEFNRYHPTKHQGYIGMPANVMLYDRAKPTRLHNCRSLADDTSAILCAEDDNECVTKKTQRSMAPPILGTSRNKSDVKLALFSTDENP